MKKESLFSGLLLVIVMMFFLNCSKTHFSDVGAESSESLVSNENQSISLTLNKAESDSNLPISFDIFLDISYSNSNNLKNLIGQLKDLFSNLPAQTLSINIYYLGDSSYKLYEDVLVEKKALNSTDTLIRYQLKINLPSLSVGKTSQDSETDFKLKLDEMISALESKISAVTPGRQDSTPTVQNELATLFYQRTVKKVPGRVVSLIITDEDISSSKSSSPIYSRYEYVERKMPSESQKGIEFPAERKVTLEGGGSTWVRNSFFTASFTECTSSNIKAALSSTIYRQVDDSLENCKKKTNGYGYVTKTLTETMKYESITGEVVDPKAYGLSMNSTEQYKKLAESEFAPQQFIGVFSIQDLNEIASTDQEIAINLEKYITSICSVENLAFQSIVKPNFEEFVDQVINFKNLSSNNSISIQKLMDFNPSKKLRIHSVRILQNDQVDNSPGFTIVNNTLRITKTNLDLLLGAQVSLDYSFE